MKRITLIFALICWLQSIGAQTGNVTTYPKFEKGYIELKDGRVIRGEYIYSPELDKIRIYTGKESFVLDALEVIRITKKRPNANDAEKTKDLDDSYAPIVKNYFIWSELGVLVGNPDNANKSPLAFHTSVNYKFLEKLSAGLGVGVEFYRETYLPVTVNGLYKLSNAKFTPFVMLQAGYQIPIEGSRTKVQNVMPANVRYIWPGPTIPYETDLKAMGGVLFNPSLGVMWQSKSNVGFTFAAGYRFHRLRYNNSEKEYNLNVDYNRLSLKLGIIF